MELPSSVSNCSVVEIHVDVSHNVFLGHMNRVEINIELPLHARYPVCERNSHQRNRKYSLGTFSCFFSFSDRALLEVSSICYTFQLIFLLKIEIDRFYANTIAIRTSFRIGIVNCL